MTTLSTHVLDTVTGRPAAGLDVALEQIEDSGAAHRAGGGRTNHDGRVTDLLDDEASFGPGTWRLTFDTGGWSFANDRACFYPEIAVTFTVSTSGHHHVPLLLSPYGYSTYRGS